MRSGIINNLSLVKFEVYMVVKIHAKVFWVVMLHNEDEGSKAL
jgi:hypothetical protein